MTPSRHVPSQTALVEREYSCEACGTTYNHIFEMRLPYEQGEREKALAKRGKRVENVPCPGCGRSTSHAAAARRQMFAVGVGASSAIASLSALVVWCRYPLSEFAVSISAPLSCFSSILIILYLIAARNRPSASGRERARRLIRAGEVYAVRDAGGHREAPRTGGGLRRGCLNALPFIGSALVVSTGANIHILDDQYNKEFIQSYIGPGDSFEIGMSQEIQAVKKLWRGQPEVLLLNEGPVAGPLRLRGSGSDETWRGTLITRDYAERATVHPQVVITLPDDENLARNRFVLRVWMSVTYPRLVEREHGRDLSYQDQTADLESSFTLHTTDAATAYRLRYFWVSVGSFGTLCALLPPIAGFWFARRWVRSNPLPVLVEARRGSGTYYSV